MKRHLRKIQKILQSKQALPEGIKAIVVVFHDYEREYANEEFGYLADKALPKLLSIEKKFGVKANYNIVGKIMESHPQTITSITKHGHEISSHTYGHIVPSRSSKKEFEADTKSFLKFANKFGIKVKGYRSPESGFSDSVAQVLEQYGFVWNAEADHHAQPYWLTEKILRIPVIDDDWHLMTGHANSEELLDLFRDHLASMKKHKGIAGFGTHPWVLGMSQDRIEMYEKFLRELSEDPEIQLMTFSEVHTFMCDSKR